MKRLLSSAVVAVVLVVSGCGTSVWPQLGQGPENARFNSGEAAITPSNVASLSEVWTSAPIFGSMSEPIVSGNEVYATVSPSGSAPSVRAYNLVTGDVDWETPNLGGPVVLVGDRLWAADSTTGCTSHLVVLDPDDGHIVSTEDTSAPVEGAVVGTGSIVAYTTNTGCPQTENRAELVVQEAGSGAGRWTYRFPADVEPTMPSIGQGKVFVSAGQDLYAFDPAGCGGATCDPSWVTSLAIDQSGVILGPDARPVVGPDGLVHVAVVNRLDIATFVQTLDVGTGEKVWRTDTHPGPGLGWQGLAVAHGQLYVSDHRQTGPAGQVEVFAAAGCGLSLCRPSWTAVIHGSPVANMTVGGEVLYFGLFRSAGMRLVAFDARGCASTTCTELGHVAFGDLQPVKMAVAGGRVVAVAANGSGQILRVLAPTEG